MRNIHYILSLMMVVMMSCNAGKKQGASKLGSDVVSTVVFEEAKVISVIADDDKVTKIQIHNPWKEDVLLDSYTIGGENGLRVPLKRVVVYSSVHANVIKELGHLEAIKGVCDVQYFTIEEVKEGVKNGTIENVGTSAAPITEKIISISPDAIIVSAYQNSKFDNLEKLGIPVIQCADYMETSPLGRAEWIKLFGFLFNEQAKADSIYNAVREQYNDMKQLVAGVEKKPKILSENIVNGTWYVPGGNSYMAHLFSDAGGEFAWNDTPTSGSIPLDMPQVLDKAHDADIWLIKSFDAKMNYNKLKAQNELNAEFEAFKKQKVWHCDTERTTLFQDFPFHPELLLKEYIAIFHPQLMPDYETIYFKPLDNE